MKQRDVIAVVRLPNVFVGFGWFEVNEVGPSEPYTLTKPVRELRDEVSTAEYHCI